jgi:cytochrome c peroxidase
LLAALPYQRLEIAPVSTAPHALQTLEHSILTAHLAKPQMATATRTFTRALRTSARPAFTAAPRIAFRQSGRRFYSSEPAAKQGSSAWLWLAGAAAVGGAGAWFYSSNQGPATPKVFTPKFEDYQAVYNEIANRLDEKEDYDDGSYGPVLLRLAWHASGTYDKETGTGGSNGATMRFSPESDHGANAGLKAARDFLEPVKGECCMQLEPERKKARDG